MYHAQRHPMQHLFGMGGPSMGGASAGDWTSNGKWKEALLGGGAAAAGYAAPVGYSIPLGAMTITPGMSLPVKVEERRSSLGTTTMTSEGYESRSSSRGAAPHANDDSRGSRGSRRQSISYEMMTDEEREEAIRLKRKEEAFKTALCDAFKKTGSCSYGEACRFAHGENELRLPLQPRGKAHPKYKTQLCDKFSVQGHCPYGPRCQFIHKLKKGLPLMEYERLLAAGSISPAREDEPLHPDEDREEIGGSQWHSRQSNTRSGASHQPPAFGYDGFAMQQQQHRRKGFRGGNDRPHWHGGRHNGGDRHYQRQQRGYEPRNDYGCGEHWQGGRWERRGGDHGRCADGEWDMPITDRVDRMDKDTNDMWESREKKSSTGDASDGLVRASSLHAIMIDDDGEVFHDEAVARKAKKPDLSLIREEPEEEQPGSPRRVVKRVPIEKNMTKKLGTIDEEGGDECGQRRKSARSEVEMLTTSCDEELLAAGLYSHRYPTPTHLAHH